MKMNKNSKIYIAGHRGMVGSALSRRLLHQGFVNLITRTREELDLEKQQSVEHFFATEQPDFVLLAAARVGGIHANNTYPAEFIHQNIIIQDNIIHQAWKNNVKGLLFLGSSCIYPKACPQPIKEEYLLTGPLESTNRPYAVAKIAGIETCWAYNRQYGTRYIAVMPNNMYGLGDNYDLNNSHVLPALLRKMHEAKINNSDHVVVWGTGKPRREFVYSEDLADACIHIMTRSESELNDLFSEDTAPLINIGYGKDQTILELANQIKDIVGFKGSIIWDKSKPDGTMQKLMEVDKINKLGWEAKTGLKEGLKIVYKDFLKTYTP